MVSSAISRSATTGFLSLSRSSVSCAPPTMSRARCADSSTSSKRFGTLRMQSSTVTRAMKGYLQKSPVVPHYMGCFIAPQQALGWNRRICLTGESDIPAMDRRRFASGHRPAADFLEQCRHAAIGKPLEDEDIGLFGEFGAILGTVEQVQHRSREIRRLVGAAVVPPGLERQP